MITAYLERLSSQLLLPVDQITAALCLLLAFPFAFLLNFAVFRRRPCHRLINWLAIAPTYLFLYICFYVARGGQEEEKLPNFIWDLLSIHLPVIFVYISTKYSKFLRNNPTVIFAVLLAQLSYHHISRQLHFFNQYTVNVTGPLMILIIKLSSFAYDVQSDKIKLETVSFEGFMAWCLLFAGFFTGPVVNFTDFQNFCHEPNKFFALKKDDDHDDDNTANSHEKGVDDKMLKGRKRRATFLILSATLLLIFGLLLQPHFPTQQLLEVSESRFSIFYKIVFMHLSLLGWRIKYYVAWSLAEGALVIIGLGFTLKDGKIKWYKQIYLLILLIFLLILLL